MKLSKTHAQILAAAVFVIVYATPSAMGKLRH